MKLNDIKKPGLKKGFYRTEADIEAQEEAFAVEYGEKTGTRTKYVKPNNPGTKKLLQSKTEEIIVTGRSKYEPKIEKLLLKRRK